MFIGKINFPPLVEWANLNNARSASSLSLQSETSSNIMQLTNSTDSKLVFSDSGKLRKSNVEML